MNGNKNSMFLASLIYMVLGLVLLFFPRLTTELLCTVVGVLLLAYGGTTIFSFFRRKDSTSSFSMVAELILGVLSALVGIFFLTRSDLIISIIPVILGLYILIDALVNLKRGLDMRSYGYAGWTTTLVMSVLSLVFGLLILRHPFGIGLALWRVIGGVFLYQGISDFWALYLLEKLRNGE